MSRPVIFLVLAIGGINFCASTQTLRNYPVIDKIRAAGYPVEEHFIQTSDGYILGTHRIPHGKNEVTKFRKSRPVVFLQHGLLCSSSNWILLGSTEGLAFLLADAGFDVWMGNSRGNTYSRRHAWLRPSSRKFWNFSWHEMGLYDLPASIDYALNLTGNSQLHYISHSQGSASFFVMCSLKPDYNKKIIAMNALAPAAYISHARSPIFRAIAPFLKDFKYLMFLFGDREFLPSSKLFDFAGAFLCKNGSIFQELCANILFLIAGYDWENLNRTLLPDVIASTPAGASINEIIHYSQNYKSKNFRMFDYGLLKNVAVYGSFSPPVYDLQKVMAPITIYYGDNDWLVGVKDIEELAGKLGNLKKKIRVNHKKWNHLDYIWGIDAKRLIYENIIYDLLNFYKN